jgi:hypothetical protein
MDSGVENVNGTVPDEVYFDKTDGVVESLTAGRVVARAERLKANQAVSCPSCLRFPPKRAARSRQRSDRS